MAGYCKIYSEREMSRTRASRARKPILMNFL